MSPPCPRPLAHAGPRVGSYPRKKVFDQPDRRPKKGPMAHTVMLANGGETSRGRVFH
jgi:hypothetical protein